VVPTNDEILNRANYFTQVRILSIIEIWITRHPDNFSQETELYKLTSEFLRETALPHRIVESNIKLLEFSKTIPQPKNTFFQENLTVFQKDHLLPSSQSSSYASSIDSRKNSSQSVNSSIPNSFQLDSITPEDFAEQLTLLDLEIFSQIPLKDFREYLLDPMNTKENQLRFMEKWEERFLLWIAFQICEPTSSKKRVEVVQYFLRVSIRCWELQNYNGVFTILRAFLSSPVRRLKKTWDSLPPHLQEAFHVLIFSYLILFYLK